MSEDFGGNIYTVSDEDGNNYALEHLDTIEYKGKFYLAFAPADMDEDSEDYGMVIMRQDNDGKEDYLAVPDDDELEEVYEVFMEQIFSDEETEE